MQYPLNRIITICNQLTQGKRTGASTGEVIAAAFVLNNMEYLPPGYSVIEAWERIEDWQHHVKRIRYDYLHLINEEGGA